MIKYVCIATLVVLSACSTVVQKDSNNCSYLVHLYEQRAADHEDNIEQVWLRDGYQTLIDVIKSGNDSFKEFSYETYGLLSTEDVYEVASWYSYLYKYHDDCETAHKLFDSAAQNFVAYHYWLLLEIDKDLPDENKYLNVIPQFYADGKINRHE